MQSEGCGTWSVCVCVCVCVSGIGRIWVPERALCARVIFKRRDKAEWLKDIMMAAVFLALAGEGISERVSNNTQYAAVAHVPSTTHPFS